MKNESNLNDSTGVFFRINNRLDDQGDIWEEEMTEKLKVIPKIYADSRETRSGRISELATLKADYHIVPNLELGDYILSDRCGVEIKETSDFLKSFIEDRKLFSQIHDLTMGYSRPLLIIEGVPDELFTSRLINANAVWAILQVIAVSFRCPTIFTLNPRETAYNLYQIAQREQTESSGNFHPHGRRSHRNPNEQLLYSLESLPDMGVSTAKNLLTAFSTIQAIANAEREDLENVDLVGPKTSAGIYEFFRREYVPK